MADESLLHSYFLCVKVFVLFSYPTVTVLLSLVRAAVVSSLATRAPNMMQDSS